ncbi:MAG: TorF family putative porin [Pseudomonadales bacterium]|jgi:uncharacterized protein (TIGR02001 family)|nr:TorF family putative porin [Pseudomonadales bacterium]
MSSLIFSAAIRADSDWSGDWSGNITAVSAYVSRGFEQSWGQSALQGGAQYRYAEHWFIGTWGSTLSPYFIEGGSLEWDFYAGYANAYKGLDYQAGLYYYRYPGARSSATGTRYDYGEAIISIGLRGITLAYALTVTPDYFGFNSASVGQGAGLRSRGSGYLALDGALELNDRYTLKVHGGQQTVRNFSDYGWVDAQVSLATRLYALDLALGYARAWNTQGVYRRYTTGVPDGAGVLHVMDPIAGRWFLSVGWAF